MESKKRTGGNQTFFKDNTASILEKMVNIVMYVKAFHSYFCLVISDICVVEPIFVWDLNSPC